MRARHAKRTQRIPQAGGEVYSRRVPRMAHECGLLLTDAARTAIAFVFKCAATRRRDKYIAGQIQEVY